MSEIRATTISDAAGTGPITLTGQSAAKVTLEFNQIAPSIGGSLNVSSVTDSSVGNFTINVTNAFANAASRMIAAAGIQKGAHWLFVGGPNNDLTTSMPMGSIRADDTPADGTSGVVAHGDLA